MKKMVLAILLVIVAAYLCGCGETISGIGKDLSRMGQGVNTFFFRQGGE